MPDKERPERVPPPPTDDPDYLRERHPVPAPTPEPPPPTENPDRVRKDDT
jgi:hypothetical protein